MQSQLGKVSELVLGSVPRPPAGELAQTGGIFARLVAAARSDGGHQH